MHLYDSASPPRFCSFATPVSASQWPSNSTTCPTTQQAKHTNKQISKTIHQHLQWLALLNSLLAPPLRRSCTSPLHAQRLDCTVSWRATVLCRLAKAHECSTTQQHSLEGCAWARDVAPVEGTQDSCPIHRPASIASMSCTRPSLRSSTAAM